MLRALLVATLLLAVASVPVSAQIRETGEHKMLVTTLGCIDKADSAKFRLIINQNDDAAAKDFMNRAGDAGRCILLQKDEAVFVDDMMGAPDYLLLVRRKGESREFWTWIEVVSPPGDHH